MRHNSDLLITPEHTNASSCLQSFIDTHIILLDTFTEGQRMCSGGLVTISTYRLSSFSSSWESS